MKTGKIAIPRQATRRQQDFVIAYYETGCAAEAARAAGYKGKYAAQAGYKLLRKRKGVRAEFEYWERLASLYLRRQVRRALLLVRRAAADRKVPVGALERLAGPLAEALQKLGMSEDRSCRFLMTRARCIPVQPRRLYPLPWEEENNAA